jgi:predicted RNA-binding Zn ribbon-like protein
MDADGFLWLGNHPAADLCNTRPLVDGEPRELLVSFADVERWARRAGIDVPDGLARRCDAETAEETREWVVRLRGELRAVLDPDAAGHDLVPLNNLLAQVRGSFEVLDTGRPTVRLSSEDQVTQFRLDLAAAVLDVFSHDLALVRRCDNPACVLLFLDTSKSRRRRWCDMTTCGNRAKAATHYARRRAG